ncbi:mediator of RNA polymerase II transcription subunit 15 isoform X5 [Anoplophora glabripennis]|uniref:mediator of RNA polymerase II transcription subunit 15 isoform X5 n=1 Tax=Anoplophora glabripennis TaxID=217634 RepID=UPI000874FC89|nr:mediator of RNA polymerase II transcription subunit 15 isoform X5 [Anoplophora glabripennis]
MAAHPKLVNKQFNSPIGLYSPQNIQEVLERETQILANGAVGINFNNPNVGKPANLKNSAVLRMLEEEENRQRNGIGPGAKRVAWPPPSESGSDSPYVEQNSVSAQGGPQISSQSPGFQQNNYQAPAQQRSVSSNPPTNRPLKPLDVSTGSSSPLSSPLLNQSPHGFRPSTPAKGWAPVQSPVATPSPPSWQQHPPVQHQQSTTSTTQHPPLQHQLSTSSTASSTTRYQTAHQSVSQQTFLGQQYLPSSEVQYQTTQQYQSSQQYQPPQQKSQQQYQPQKQFQSPQQQYQLPQQQYQPPQQQYQPPQQQYQVPPQQQYQAPSQQQYQAPPQQQYQAPPQQQYQAPSQQQYQAPPQQQYQAPPQQQYQAPPQQQYQAPPQQQYQATSQHQYQASPQQYQASTQQQYQASTQQYQASTQQNQAFQPSQSAPKPAAAPSQVAPRAAPASKQAQPPPPTTITLRPKAPVSQAPPPLVTSQPATATLKGGKHLRGDLKWPPECVRQQFAEEDRLRLELAQGPACRPLRPHKDYSEFFNQHALNSTYPGYKIPPGTQFFRPV